MTAVYIETTIPSFYHTARTDTRSLARHRWTRDWWDKIAPSFELHCSDAVIVELERGTLEELKTQRIELISELPLLEITDDVFNVARIYVERIVMPRDGAGDALHLALASFYSMDVLLTWNCKHLANPNKFGHIDRVNKELGLQSPLLTTPLNYLSEDESDGD
ncbi:MAG: type II toxin-antitoxin system VapC family toxin [Planctomycetes bacterium]|nr:type II toxin-antitoxin system VapC family toxin [Planctomycetota bacterium]